jgi:Cu(I)-responsive transcriptional regulator
MSLRIGDLATRTGVKVATIRWYEKVGLLTEPNRTGSNYRLYADDALRRLTFIRRARDLGFSLDEVRELLDLADDGSRDCAAVDEIARRHLADVESKLADLARLRERLSRLVSSCAGGAVDDCRILEALGPASF